ncbi:MAG TPA: 3,4-dihydroxy-2-butanone-4-phosphate synthase [Alphaproteobacteria bacterium]|nr:3,4-dihydroxy-2-butanone-4-phosphate synthase [Alphaproteobacteria bacterium]HNS45361.1 3,4-dihydroxy-2-butanone-4-phosphate synthase [Alphaproteobacteria bacterium]
MLNVVPKMESGLSSAEEIIEEARNGRMFILVDDENRENEGDLIIPAQMATPEAIAFMAKEGRGLICLAMEGPMIDHLNLPLMGQQQARMQTAFTVSIEAREGVTTGISAADRARTIQVAIASDSHAEDIVTPGHVFPLRAREGGVLVRAGHTEAAVDVSRLAGLRAAGVICEVMKDDGTMARLPDLMPFAKSHGLKIGTIEDLIAFRRKTEKIIEQIAVTDFNSKWGEGFKLHTYRNMIDGTEHMALVLGDIKNGEPVSVRVHVENTVQDLLSAEDNSLDQAMKKITAKGRGVLILIRDHNKQFAHDQKRPPEYGIGSQMIYDLGVRDMIVLTNHPTTVTGLDAYNLKISGFECLQG